MLHFVSGFVKGMRDSKFVKNSFEIKSFIVQVGPLIVYIFSLSLGWYSKSKTSQQSKKKFSSRNTELSEL